MSVPLSQAMKDLLENYEPLEMAVVFKREGRTYTFDAISFVSEVSYDAGNKEWEMRGRLIAGSESIDPATLPTTGKIGKRRITVE